jgi:demethylspheroidene O-methyltransferase
VTRIHPDGVGSVIAKTRSALQSSWLDRCFAARDRLLADARFQRWAAAFPLTKRVARRRAQALFDVCAGFVYSQVLFACVELGVFDILSGQPQTVAQLSRRLSLSTQATQRLLDAAASLRLVERRGSDRFGLGVLGAALLGNPGVAAMVEHHRLLYADLDDPVALLRGARRDTALARYWPYAGAERPVALTPEQVRDYTALMSASQALIAGDVLDAYPLHGHRRLLDVGGGEGTFLIAATSRVAELEVILFDLPAVADRARTGFAAAGLSHRAEAIGGDFLLQSLPEGADIVSLVRVIHDHDDAAAFALLRNVRRALPRDGTLLIAEPMADTASAEPVGIAYFGFYLLAMGSGRPRTPHELRLLVREAGFYRIRQVATRRPMLTQVLVAHCSN